MVLTFFCVFILSSFHPVVADEKSDVKKDLKIQESDKNSIDYIHSERKGISIVLSGQDKKSFFDSIFVKKKYINLSFPGINMKDIKQIAYYLVKNYKVDHIVLPISFSLTENNQSARLNADDWVFQIRLRMKKELFSSRYLQRLSTALWNSKKLIVPDIESKDRGTFFDIFVSEPENYDIRVKQTEYIGSVQEYLEYHPEFKLKRESRKISDMDEFFKDLKELLNLLNRKGVNYTLIMPPMHNNRYHSYEKSEVEVFMSRLAQTSDFYDFTYSCISNDSRYFHDEENYRSDVANMMFRRIFNEEGYIPPDFGTYVEKGSSYFVKEVGSCNLEKKIKVLMLHHIDDNILNLAIINKKKLIELFEMIRKKDYKVITLSDMEKFVKNGADLPEKSVLLTFDDGYKSNFDIVYPLLKEYNYKAVFFPIGVSIGKNKYKGTDYNITPHYSFEEIKEMKDSEYVEFGSHGFDIHQSGEFESEKARRSILKFADEKEKEYVQFLNSDFEKFNQIFNTYPLKINSIAYPLGEYDSLSNVIVAENGIEISFTTRKGEVHLLKGLNQSMLNLNRINVDMHSDLDIILE